MKTTTTTTRLHQGQWAGYWMVTDPTRRSYVAVVDCFGVLVEVADTQRILKEVI